MTKYIFLLSQRHVNSDVNKRISIFPKIMNITVRVLSRVKDHLWGLYARKQ